MSGSEAQISHNRRPGRPKSSKFNNCGLFLLRSFLLRKVSGSEAHIGYNRRPSQKLGIYQFGNIFVAPLSRERGVISHYRRPDRPRSSEFTNCGFLLFLSWDGVSRSETQSCHNRRPDWPRSSALNNLGLLFVFFLAGGVPGSEAQIGHNRRPDRPRSSEFNNCGLLRFFYCERGFTL